MEELPEAYLTCPHLDDEGCCSSVQSFVECKGLLRNVLANPICISGIWALLPISLPYLVGMLLDLVDHWSCERYPGF